MPSIKHLFQYYFKTQSDISRESLEFHLKNSYLFEYLSPTELGRLKNICHERTYKAGEYIFHTGKEADAVYIIKTGKVVITCNPSPDKEEILTELESGEFFGETGLLPKVQRMANATAASQTELIAIMRDEFNGFVGRFPRTGTKILLQLINVLGQRLMKSNQEIIQSMKESDDASA